MYENTVGGSILYTNMWYMKHMAKLFTLHKSRRHGI